MQVNSANEKFLRSDEVKLKRFQWEVERKTPKDGNEALNISSEISMKTGHIIFVVVEMIPK